MRLIDADRLKAYLLENYIMYDHTLADIDAQPTVDIESARHGRWKQSKYYKNIIFCDECGEPFELSNSIEHWNYCPNCGAKMEGKRREDETD